MYHVLVNIDTNYYKFVIIVTIYIIMNSKYFQTA